MKILLALCLLVAAAGATYLALATDSIAISILFLFVAVDLIASVFAKPLIGPGPIAKFLYPCLENEQETSVSERQTNLAGNETDKAVGNDPHR
jgi:hypothetical protein